MIMHWTIERGLTAVMLLSVMAGCSTPRSATVIPPRALTQNRMGTMKQRVLRYANTNDALPATARNLPEIDSKVNESVDAWGREILMAFDSKQATLCSFGKDGKRGGAGDDADMIAVFPLQDENGNWEDEHVDWTVDPK